MGKYKIIVSYEDGDSFGSHDTEDLISLEWDDLDVAKENLQRIKAHETVYGKHYLDWSETKQQREERLKAAKEADWYANDQHRLFLFNDQGERYCQSVFWTGYFERFHGAKIVEDRSDWEI